MKFSIKSQQIFATDKATVWDWITGKYFVRTYFPEMSGDASALTEYVRATHKAGSQIRPSWVIKGKSIAWDANASTNITLLCDDVEVESVRISLEQQGEHTAVTLEVTSDTDFGPSYWGVRKNVKTFIRDKLSALREDIETPETYIELPTAA